MIEGVINQLYTRYQFAVSEEQILSPEEVAIDQFVSLRKGFTRISQTVGVEMLGKVSIEEV